jgi:SAM-dependent methyltransferase
MYVSHEKRKRIHGRIREALDAPFSGWDFSYIHKWGAKPEFPLPWNYREAVTERIKSSRRMLDIGTGGGEFLSSLSPLPNEVYATEAYSPNVLVAERRLSSLGIKVVKTGQGLQERSPLPFQDAFFDLAINRHECYESKELFRILRPRGYLITQQVGESDFERLRTIFGVLGEDEVEFSWDLANAHRFLQARESGTNHRERRIL